MRKIIGLIQKPLERALKEGSTNRTMNQLVFAKTSILVFDEGHTMQPWSKGRFSSKLSHRRYQRVGPLVAEVVQGAMSADGSDLGPGDVFELTVGHHLLEPGENAVAVVYLAECAGRPARKVIDCASEVQVGSESFKVLSETGSHLGRGNVVDGAVHVLAGSWDRDDVTWLAGSTMPLGGGLLAPRSEDSRFVVVDQPGWTLHPSVTWDKGWLPRNRLSRIGGRIEGPGVQPGDPRLLLFKAPWQRMNKSGGVVFDARDLHRAIALNIELLGDDWIASSVFIGAMIDAYVRCPPAVVDMHRVQVDRGTDGLLDDLVAALSRGSGSAELAAAVERYQPLEAEHVISLTKAWMKDAELRGRVGLASLLEAARARYSS